MIVFCAHGKGDPGLHHTSTCTSSVIMNVILSTLLHNEANYSPNSSPTISSPSKQIRNILIVTQTGVDWKQRASCYPCQRTREVWLDYTGRPTGEKQLPSHLNVQVHCL